MAAKKKQSFEQNLLKLEELVRGLESGDLTLDESLKAFETAKKLEKELEAELDSAKARMTILTEDGEKDFDAGSDEA